MGNKVIIIVKEECEEIYLKVVFLVDRVFVCWFVRDLQRVQGFKLKNICVIIFFDSYIEFMWLNGLFDVDLDDFDFVYLFK